MISYHCKIQLNCDQENEENEQNHSLLIHHSQSYAGPNTEWGRNEGYPSDSVPVHAEQVCVGKEERDESPHRKQTLSHNELSSSTPKYEAETKCCGYQEQWFHEFKDVGCHVQTLLVDWTEIGVVIID